MEHNPYRGVNAHLNSFLQLEGWESFHTAFINEMSQFIDRILPPNYYAAVSVEPLISTQTAAPEMQLPLLVDEEETISATLIYHVEGGRFPGTPITRIELLSPSNKRGGSGYLTYLGKRSQTLRSGLRLVEIDFMHEQPPISRQLPSYPDRDPGSFPYMILVNDPRPNLSEGQTAFYGSHVNNPLRVIAVPLADNDVIAVDFDAVYNQTFESYRVFRMLVDYHFEPARFATYSPDDQQRIRAKMGEIGGQT